jgi:hypothetical protein
VGPLGRYFVTFFGTWLLIGGVFAFAAPYLLPVESERRLILAAGIVVAAVAADRIARRLTGWRPDGSGRR